MTFNDLWGPTMFNKKVHLHNVSFHINSYQDWFINEYARKKKGKISELQNLWVTEFFSEILEELTFSITLESINAAQITKRIQNNILKTKSLMFSAVHFLWHVLVLPFNLESSLNRYRIVDIFWLIIFF